MARTFTMGIVFVLASSFLAGCLGDAGDLVEPGDGAPSGAAPWSLDVSMTNCQEGGGVSLYNMEEGSGGPVQPFRRTDIQDDVGRPLVASYGQPIPPGGATTGIWHVSLVCESYTRDGVAKGPLEWGWVGVRILPPPWDDSGIERQYFVADLSFADPEIVKALQGSLALHASRTLDVKIEWLGPLLLHTILDDEDHGVFETHAKMRDYRAYEPGPMRFWMLVAVGAAGHDHEAADDENVTYRPVSFDIVNTAGDGHFVVDGTGFLSHTRTDAHGAVPGAAGNLGGVLYTGVDRSMRLGPAPDILLDDTWTH